MIHIDERKIKQAVDRHEARTGEDCIIIYVPMPELTLFGAKVIFNERQPCLETKGETTRLFHDPNQEIKLNLIKND